MINLLKEKRELFKTISILFMILFVACFYITTAGFFISWSFLAILALLSYIAYKKIDFSRNDLWLFLLAYPLGAIINLFSLNGLLGTFGFLEFDSQILTLLILMILNPSLKSYKYILYTVTIASIIASLYAFFLRMYPEYYVSVYNEDPNMLLWRLRSFRAIINWGEALQFAIILVLSAVFAFKKPIIRSLFFVSLLILLLALFFSGSRSAFVSIIVGSGFLMMLHIKKRFIIIFSSALMIILALVYHYRDTNIGSRYYSIYNVESNNSNIQRVASWKMGLKIAKENIWSGIGVNTIKKSTEDFVKTLSQEEQDKWNSTYSKTSHTFENSYINVLAQSGIIYFLYFFGFMFYFMIKIGVKLRKLKHQDKYLITGIYASLVAFMVNMVFFHSIEGSAGFFFFFLMFFLIKFTDNRYHEKQEQQ